MERTTTIEWQGRPIEAADPEPISAATFDLSASAIRATERAAAAVGAVAHRAGPTADVVGRLLLRAEGLASSAIEGLRVSAEAVALAEEGATSDPTAAWVADNLVVVEEALATPAPLALDSVLSWHRRLMRHAVDFDPAHAGVWRPVIGWIGGINPLVAAHVASPPTLIAPGMADVIAFLRRDDLDPITMAAIAHAQFETIHPFADGNGRIGRVLIGWTLATGLDVATPPPVSTAFARDIGGYLSGLTLYRQGSVDHWVRWFANAVLDAAHRSDAVFDGVDDVIRRWRTQTGSLRSDAAARRLIDELVRRPVIDVATAAQLLDVSRVTARSAIQVLAAEGILTEQDVPPTKHGRPGTWWAATDLLALLGG